MDETTKLDSPRGTKRKAGELDERVTRRIKALDQDVVNKIAAGEIIVAPVHALKELIENAVDAGSTSIEVLVKEGGLKLLQITDNGSGIDKQDLPLLCERFTTSKLEKLEDLQSIATYGFRGEALASISQIASLSVTTRTKQSECAWRAHYDSGRLAPAKPGQSPDPKSVAGRQGTQITAEDLFYNVPTRRRAFRSASDEYNKIIDMLGRYAIHTKGVAFSCKKYGDASMSVAIQANASVADRIRQIQGNGVANELISYSTSDDRWAFKAEGLATNANYSVKKTTLFLFINHRSVESTNIRKALEQTYAAFLPKSGHPFVYLSLEIDPRRVDVNVHPTKREVNFLNEDEITQAVCEHLRSKLAAVDTSRTFLTQTLLSGVGWSMPAESRAMNASQAISSSKIGSTSNVHRGGAVRSDNSLIRTDTNMRKITSMFAPVARNTTEQQAAAGDAQLNSEGPRYETVEREQTAVRLTSVRELRAAVRQDMHHNLTDMLANHSFVGVVDEYRRLAAVQGGVRLFLVDYGRACYEYFYQVGLAEFANMGAIRFCPPLDLRELLTMAARQQQDCTSDSEINHLVETVAGQLAERREMLLEYFSLEVGPTGDLLHTIPLLIRGYNPPMAKLPQFLLRLGHQVAWNDEKACFETFLRELASFYVPEQLPPLRGAGRQTQTQTQEQQRQGEDNEDVDPELAARRCHVRWAVEHVFFPAFKARLVATKSLVTSGVLEIANLKGLYRVFERC